MVVVEAVKAMRVKGDPSALWELDGYERLEMTLIG